MSSIKLYPWAKVKDKNARILMKGIKALAVATINDNKVDANKFPIFLLMLLIIHLDIFYWP